MQRQQLLGCLPPAPPPPAPPTPPAVPTHRSPHHPPTHPPPPGERGVGGSKCGATAANVMLYRGADGGMKLLAANVGDARTLLIRGGRAIDVSEEHVPDK